MSKKFNEIPSIQDDVKDRYQKIEESNGIRRNEEITQEPKILVEDRRDPNTAYGFNLNKFLEDIKIFLMKPKEFNEFMHNNKDFYKKYGGLSESSYAESETFRESLRNSLAIKIVIEDVAKTINKNLLERTIVYVYMIRNKNKGEVMSLFFDKKGNYVSYGSTIKMKDQDLKQINKIKEIK